MREQCEIAVIAEHVALARHLSEFAARLNAFACQRTYLTRVRLPSPFLSALVRALHVLREEGALRHDEHEHQPEQAEYLEAHPGSCGA